MGLNKSKCGFLDKCSIFRGVQLIGHDWGIKVSTFPHTFLATSMRVDFLMHITWQGVSAHTEIPLLCSLNIPARKGTMDDPLHQFMLLSTGACIVEGSLAKLRLVLCNRYITSPAVTTC